MSASALWAGVDLPVGAQPLAKRETPLGSYALPVGAYANDEVPVRVVEGRILRRTWRISGDATVLQILEPLRTQLLDQGYEVLFECESRLCGGFDFRFGIEVVPAPDMAVNIGDYHFLSAIKGTRAVSLLVTRSGMSAYLQLIEVSPKDLPSLTIAQSDAPVSVDSRSAENGLPDIGAELMEKGHAVLTGLDFGSGAVSLEQETYSSLTALAAFLEANPQYSVVVVGHTDTVGTLGDNIALSRRRAEVVKRFLVEKAGVDSARIAVGGAGYLAPVASNRTEKGREANRRVEVVLLSGAR